jgi:uncharacterized protein with PQ loop repeat
MTYGVILQLLGLMAGAIICSSAVPRVREIWRNPQVAAGESLTRNARIVGGNVLWVVYGVLMGTPAITIMCGISVVLNGVILFATLRAKRQPPTNRPTMALHGHTHRKALT